MIRTTTTIANQLRKAQMSTYFHFKTAWTVQIRMKMRLTNRNNSSSSSKIGVRVSLRNQWIAALIITTTLTMYLLLCPTNHLMASMMKTRKKFAVHLHSNQNLHLANKVPSRKKEKNKETNKKWLLLKINFHNLRSKIEMILAISNSTNRSHLNRPSNLT